MTAPVVRVRPFGPGSAGAAIFLTMTLLLAGCAAGAASAAGSAPDEPRTTGAAPRSPTTPQGPAAPPGAVAENAEPAEPAPGIDLSAHSTADPASPWVVVNKHTPLDPLDHEPALTVVRGYLVRPDAAPDIAALLDAAAADGVHLTLRSAYRGYPKQEQVYEGWVAQLGRAGADEMSARPGHSEHQTGTAVDVGSSTRPECDFKPCFGDTVEGRWVAQHAAEFGLLVRYTAENSTITGYGPEPWHLRWVGRDLAAYLRETGVTTLEEAFDVPGGDYVD